MCAHPCSWAVSGTGTPPARRSWPPEGLVEPEEVADAVVAALAEERFFVLPHPEVAEYMRHRAEDPERWLAGMRRMWRQLSEPRPDS